jgi:hypothetical protein
MEAMERAYRRRLAAVRWVLSGIAFTCLTVSHFTFGPMFPPLIAVAVTCALIVGWGERIVFPLAWRTFDGPRPSPALAEEARKLAREMGVRFGGLRESRAREAAAGWCGKTLVVPPWFRELSEGERRYALARQLADAPGLWISALHFIGWPLFFGWYATWQFEFPGLAWLLGSAVFVPLFLRVVSAPKRYRVAQRRARELTSLEAEIAFLTRAREHGSRAAAWDLGRLCRNEAQ